MKVGLSACSSGHLPEWEDQITELTMSVFELLKMHISEDLPVASTREIGHGNNAKAIMIGKEYLFD